MQIESAKSDGASTLSFHKRLGTKAFANKQSILTDSANESTRTTKHVRYKHPYWAHPALFQWVVCPWYGTHHFDHAALEIINQKRDPS